MKIDISKIFILDTTPNSTLPNRFWYDTVNNQLKRYDSTTSTWKLTNTTPDNVILTAGGNQMTLTTYLNALYNQVSENQTNISTLSSNLSSKADNSEVVHKTGDESISGNKTFNDSITVNGTVINGDGVQFADNYDRIYFGNGTYLNSMDDGTQGKDILDGSSNHAPTSRLLKSIFTQYTPTSALSANYALLSGDNTFTGNNYFKDGTIYVGQSYTDGSFIESFHLNSSGIDTDTGNDITIDTGTDGVLKAGTLYLGQDSISGIDKASNYVNLSSPTRASDYRVPTSKLVSGALNSKADDASVVHLSGNETIAGDKTFTGSNTFTGTNSFTNTVSFNSSSTTFAKGFTVAGGTTYFGMLNWIDCDNGGITTTHIKLSDGSFSGVYGVLSALDTSLSGSLSDSDNIVPTSKLVNNLLSSKANDTSVVHLSGNENIGGIKSFTSSIKVVDDATTPNNTTNVTNGGVSVTGSGYTTSIDYQGVSFNNGRLEGVLGDFTSRSSTTVVNSEATYNALELKQNKTDNTLNTTSKTIVGAINELNTKLLADVPAPITDVFTSTSTSLTSIITDTSKANIQGKILISPNINNLGAVYVGQSITDKSTAFPLYPNQIVSFSFTDITNFKVATDVIGDKFNYVIEFGILNAAVTPAEGLIIVGTDGSKYRLNPSGDTGSETFTLTKIS